MITLRLSFWFAFPLSAHFMGARLKLPITPVVRLRARFARGSLLLLSEARMAIGTVKFFDSAKGFGFIQPEDGTKDVFVHISAVQRSDLGTLNEGQRVSFDVVEERGKNAAGNLQAA